MGKVKSDDGWTVQLKALSDAAAHDFRGFVSVARKAKLEELWRTFSPSWADFCRDHLERTPEFIEAMLAGAEVLGYERPFTEKEAARAGIEAAIAAGPVGAHGGDRKSEKAKDQGNSGKLTRGNDPAYAVRRLLKEGRGDLVELVRTGKLSAHAAAVQAGFRKATWQAPVDEDDLERELRKRYPGWFVRRLPGT